MLQESLGGAGDSAASAKRAQAQAQKLLQLASVRPNALTLREYREGLEDMLACPELALRESLDFFQHELFPTMDQIASQCARLQILWIGVRLHRNYASHVPFDALVRELQCETGRLFTAIWNDDDEMEGATFDDGLLGGASAEDIPGSRERAGDANTVDAQMVLGDCITLLAELQPQTQPQFLQMCEKMIATLSASGSAPAITSQQYHVIENVMTLLSTPGNLTSEPETQMSKEIFDPRDIFLPRKHFHEHREISKDEQYREPVTVTGSSDPVSIRISHHHPLSGKEDVVTLDAVELSGAVCKDEHRREPCIQVDKTRNVAQWAAYVANVSRYTGSIELKLNVWEQVNTSILSDLLAPLENSNTFQELERVGTAWNMDRGVKNGIAEASSKDEEVDQAAGYVLTYDARLYGIDHDVTPASKDPVVDERNQSIWVECRSGGPCEDVRLVEITQDIDRLVRYKEYLGDRFTYDTGSCRVEVDTMHTLLL
ncbi:hypothetical protein AM588_10004587 [Phytophthora nicotianae]|uniref:Uncharacterized protein n=1 Tax=Phytophthora nicotianae TaxID=4792 RepID=A0A0W8DD73_PHYNI|nr:hypothetical protein AM588_10004587 [Phytophthora nicotianae]